MDWSRRRQACLDAAGHRCEVRVDDRFGWQWPTQLWIGPDDRCNQRATDVDHRGSREDHDDLQALCGTHHGQKTARESAAGRAAVRAKMKLPTERPPGLL